ncbi:MAG: carboxypeptidase-like regulatory domain-containing protein [Candidatus Acidiferrales bacterium]
MDRTSILLALAISPILLFPAGAAANPQNSTDDAVARTSALSGSSTLKIRLRLPDESPFSGQANIRVVTSQGTEISGSHRADLDGETTFPDAPPGSYSIEATAPGFKPVKQSVEIAAGSRTQTLFLILRPESDAGAAQPATAASASSGFAPGSAAVSWIPPGVDQSAPPVAAGVSCALPAVLEGTGERMKQLVANLQKFSATEHLEHYPIDPTGKRLIPQKRTFDYVAVITPVAGGMFSVDEYRNGTVDRSHFPANIATEGLPAMALIFHPLLASDFNFACEGLGHWEGHPVWQVHFLQRSDRPSLIGGYRTQDHYYPFQFKGRAWIDAGTYQVRRLEFELAKPIPAVGLRDQFEIINYGSVSFHTRKQHLWLPQSAEVYVDRHGRRFYRIHTFTDFKLFTVDTDQNIHAPKESYCFTNTSDHVIAGILTVSPATGISLKAVSIQFIIPPGDSVYKVVGPGKDVSMPVDDVGSATFIHNGPAGSIKADAYLVKESTLDVIADTPIALSP